MPSSSQLTVESLLTELEEFRLPVMCDISRLTSLLKRDSAAAKDIANWVTRSPVFCLYAQRSAGLANRGRAGEIAGVEHALSMLGVAGIKKIAGQLTPSTDKPDTYLKQVTAESLFALFIADELAKLRRLNANENMAAALFARSAEWLLYWGEPRRAWQLRRMSYRKPFSGDQLGELLLGFRLSELQSTLADKFVLPNLSHRLANFSLASVLRECISAVALFREQKLLLEDCSRQLRLHLGAPEMLPLVANKLAQASCSPWLRSAWGTWVDIAAIHCHCSSSELVQMVLSAYHKFEKSGVVKTEYPVLSALICEPSDIPYQQFMANKEVAKKKVEEYKKAKHIKQPVNAEQSQVTNKKGEAKVNNVIERKSEHESGKQHGAGKKGIEKKISPVLSDSEPTFKQESKKSLSSAQSNRKHVVKSSRSSEQVISQQQLSYSRQQEGAMRKFCAQLTTKPEAFVNLQTLVSKTLKHAIDETPIERMAFFIVSKDSLNIKALVTQQKDGALPIPPLKIDLKSSTVLQKFMAKQTFLQFDKTKHGKYWAQFPDELVAEPELNRFLINSIFYSGKARAFLYADMSISHSELSDIFLKDFKRLASSFASAMKYFAQH